MTIRLKGKVAVVFCTGCGAKLHDGASFCAKCGKKVLVKTKQDETASQANATIGDASSGSSTSAPVISFTADETSTGESPAADEASASESSAEGISFATDEAPATASAPAGFSFAIDESAVAETNSAAPSASSTATQIVSPQANDAWQAAGAGGAAGVGGAATAAGASGTPASGTPKRRAPLIIAIVVIILAIAGVVGFMFWHAEQERQAEAQRQAEEQRLAQEKWEQDHKTYPLQVTFVVPEYDEANSSPVPVLVKGTDFEGGTVEEYHPMSASSNSMELMRGDYQIQVVGSPVNGEGRIYSYPTEPLEFKIDESGAHAAGGSAPASDGAEQSAENTEANGASDEGSPADTAEPAKDTPAGEGAKSPDVASSGALGSIEFNLIAPEDVTDEQIQTAKDALVNCGLKADKVDTFCDAVRTSRQARLDQIEAERRAAEEAARRANPASVDGSKEPVTLKGTLVREEWPTSKTMTGWSAVVYFLEFDTPVTVTYSYASANKTQTTQTNRLQVIAVEQYQDKANGNLAALSDPNWEPYVGRYIAVRGKLFNQGNAHCMATALFSPPSLEEVF